MKNELNKGDSSDFIGVTVSSNDDNNTSDSRIDLNNSNPKS